MTLLERLGTDLPRRYYLGLDVGYREHVAAVVSLATFVGGDSRWKRMSCVRFPSTYAGLQILQAYLDRFSTDPKDFFGLCEPTGATMGQLCFGTYWTEATI